MKEKASKSTDRKPLRLWPGVAAVAFLWLARFGIKAAIPGFDGFSLGMQVGMIGTLAVVVWWAFFSRASRLERWGGTLLMTVALVATTFVNHESMGPLWLVGYAVPVLCLALVAWAVASRHLANGPRRATLIATILLACGGWALVRTEGIDGDHVAEFSWRWAETPEERLQSDGDQVALVAAASARTSSPGHEWPGFRGPGRNSITTALSIATDWSQSPPMELWRRPIGPGWSSFAVRGDLFYTQEQRGEDEVVSCYKTATGEPVWRHHDRARFFESNAGAGPRSTPSLSGERVYTLGATGILNALDADDGTLIWSRNVSSDTEIEVPDWGFSSSPLVVDDKIFVAAGGRLAAYDLATGAPRWLGETKGGSYSSPHLLTLDGVAQILLLSDAGATSVAPSDGALLWEHEWPGFPMVQPALTADGDVLVTASQGSGVRRLAVARGPDGWTAEERWTSLRLKPYFSDFVVHDGHAFGFDGRILACIDLADGERKWKGGRYGSGQLVLLPDQDLLLVLSEKGELALVKATPERFAEFARFKAIEGKTWNHPALVGDLLLARNGQEMVAFRLFPADA